MTLHGCVMTELTYCSAHAHPEVLTWLLTTLNMSFAMKALAAAELGPHWSDAVVL